MAISEERLKFELEAQSKRVKALEYLKTQGQTVHKDLKSALSASTVQRDNTLDLVLKEKAKTITGMSATEISTKSSLLSIQESVQSKPRETEQLPHGWEKVLDESSKLYYYWNVRTNETSWERPSIVSTQISSSTSSAEVVDTLPESTDWIEVIHPATKQKYFKNVKTGQTSATVPLSSSTSVNSKGKRSGETQTAETSKLSSRKESAKETEKRRRIIVDPLDPTGGMGKWSSGLERDGKMADSTASGPLWQMRPYPAPSSIVKKPNNVSSSGPSLPGQQTRPN